MATATVSPVAAKVRTAGAYDRIFFSSMALAMAAVVLVGFGPTYYLRPFITPPATISGVTTLSPLAHLHGALFSAWVLLFIVQTALVASHRVRVHRRLGVAGALLAALMLPVAVSTAIASAARGSAPPGVDPLSFLAVPLFDMVLFPLFVAAAVWHRRNGELHKRLMLLAYTSILAAAVARLPGVFPYGPFAFFGLTLLVVVIGIVYDVITRGRVHSAYVWGGALLVISVPARLMISGTEPWLRFARFVTQ
jgi:hypothetical protein